MVNLETTVQMDCQGLQECQVLWVCQGNLACLVLKEKLVPKVLQAFLDFGEIKVPLACLESQVPQVIKVFPGPMEPLGNQAPKARVATLGCLEIQDLLAYQGQKASLDSQEPLAPEASPAFLAPKALLGTWDRREFQELKEIWDNQGHRDWESWVKGAYLVLKAPQENQEI